MDNEYMRKYMLKRYHKKKQEIIDFLGGKCKCGSIENLQIDHIERSSKKFTIAKGWSCTKEKLEEELKKCQLLCQKCHNIKTLKELGFQKVKDEDVHGTLSSYTYCKCSLCREANAKYSREWKKKNKPS